MAREGAPGMLDRQREPIFASPFGYGRRAAVRGGRRQAFGGSDQLLEGVGEMVFVAFHGDAGCVEKRRYFTGAERAGTRSLPPPEA